MWSADRPVDVENRDILDWIACHDFSHEDVTEIWTRHKQDYRLAMDPLFRLPDRIVPCGNHAGLISQEKSRTDFRAAWIGGKNDHQCIAHGPGVRIRLRIGGDTVAPQSPQGRYDYTTKTNTTFHAFGPDGHGKLPISHTTTHRFRIDDAWCHALRFPPIVGQKTGLNMAVSVQ